MAGKKTGGLGRGLDSLFADSLFDPRPERTDAAVQENASDSAEEDGLERVIYVKLSDIKPNASQPRKTFNEEALSELAASIEEHGVIQPVLLRRAKKGYELVAGERRWRAARLAGLKSIPAIVRDLDERQNAFYALIENMQREDLNMIEEALGLREMVQSFGLNQEEVAKAVGKSRSYVTNALRLLKLPEQVQEMVISGKLSAGHARAIAGLKGDKLQTEAAEKAADEGWSVRQIESYTGKASGRKPATRKKNRKSPELADAEERLSQAVGTKVRINGSESRGKLEMDYYSREELERLIELLAE